MQLNKIKHRVQFQQQIQKILEQYKISRDKFEDLSKLDMITRSKSRVWYSYQLKLKIVYVDIPNCGTETYFNSLEKLEKYLRRKYEYYLAYQQQCSDITVQISRKLIRQFYILGSYYFQYGDNYVCSEYVDDQTKLFTLTEEQLRQFIEKNKFQTQKKKQFEIFLTKNEINEFTFSQQLL